MVLHILPLFVWEKKPAKQGYRTICVFFDANGASMYRASLARQQGIVVAGCKSSSLEIRRISLLKATGSALKIEMIFEGGQKVLQKRLKTIANTGETGFYFCCQDFSRLSSDFTTRIPLCESDGITIICCTSSTLLKGKNEKS